MNEHHIGEIIRARREGVYLSIRELSRLADIHVKTLRLIERGISNPRKATLELIDGVLNQKEREFAERRKELGLDADR